MCKFFKREKRCRKKREREKTFSFRWSSERFDFFVLKPNEIHLIHSIYTEASANKLKKKEMLMANVEGKEEIHQYVAKRNGC